MAGIRNIEQQARLMPTASAAAPSAQDASPESVEVRAHRARVPMWALALRIVIGVLLIALGVLFTSQRGAGLSGADAPAAAAPAAPQAD